MTLEAAKEMDRRCVMNWLNEVYVTPSRAFDEYTEYELKMFAHDALVLLIEQKERNEPMKPTLNENHRYVSDAFKCGKCGHIIRFHAKYCENCGQAVKWE